MASALQFESTGAVLKDSLPLTDEDAALLRARNKAAWSAGSDNYRRTTLSGKDSFVMGPLIGQFVKLAKAALKGNITPACLDIASGPGEPAFSIAAAVPGATMTATDLAEGMVQAARSRAHELGLSNVTAQVADAEDLSAFQGGSIDLLTSNMGIMFFADAGRALLEWHRVLKPGGHLIVSVWDKPERMQMSSIIGDVAKLCAPGERAMINPHAQAMLDALPEITSAAGFSDVVLREFNNPMRFDSLEAIVQGTAGNPVMKEVLDKLGDSNPNVFEEAVAEVNRLCEERGFLQDDGSVYLPTNNAFIVTATA